MYRQSKAYTSRRENLLSRGRGSGRGKGRGGGLESSMATSRSRKVVVTVKRRKVIMLCQYFSSDASFSSRPTFYSNCAILIFYSHMTMVRLLIGQGPQNISGGRKLVADKGVPTYTSRHDSSAMICPRQLVFNIRHVSYSTTRQKLDKIFFDKCCIVRVHRPYTSRQTRRRLKSFRRPVAS